jgi:hypothetical protein
MTRSRISLINMLQLSLFATAVEKYCEPDRPPMASIGEAF